MPGVTTLARMVAAARSEENDRLHAGAGVGDQDVDLPELGDRCVGYRLHRGEVTDVGNLGEAAPLVSHSPLHVAR